MTSTAADLLRTCRELGLALQPHGGKLGVSPAHKASPELMVQLRTHKPALLLLLEAEAARLPADCGPWLHVARQVLAGEFDGGDRCLTQSLLIGVRNIPHRLCQQARTRLEAMLGQTLKKAAR
jgi:hypothetical protein